MTLTKKLYELQLIETNIISKEQALERINVQLEDSSLLDKARAGLENGQNCLKELKEKQHSFEWEIDSLNEKLISDKNALYGGNVKNPKELANLQHDVDNIKKKLDTLEEKALAVMEEVERVEVQVTGSQQELEQVEKEQVRLKQGLTSQKKELAASLDELKKERELLLDGIDNETYKFYYLLKGQKITAVARLERGTCRGCGIAISSAWQQRARSGELVKCTSCGRILYIGS